MIHLALECSQNFSELYFFYTKQIFLQGDSEDICKVEATVSCALGKLLLRLNEHDNTAIFLWLRNWAADSTSDKPSRLITFYR